MTSKYFKDLPLHQQQELNNLAKSKLLKTRQQLQTQGHNPENIWYTKKSYINNYQLNEMLLYNLCECGEILDNQKVLYDVAIECQGRKVLHLCKCGKKELVYS